VDKMHGELAAQARFIEITTVLGQPQSRAEEDLFVMLARWLSKDELHTLLSVAHRQCVAAAAGASDQSSPSHNSTDIGTPPHTL
jgi:hypothetical protein